MKNGLSIKILAIVLAFVCYQAKANENYPMSAGLFMTGKVSVFAGDVPNGFKVDYILTDGPDYGATCYFPLNKENKLAATLDLSMSKLGYIYKLYNDANINSTVRFSYFTVAPSINIYGFQLGFGLNIPMSVKTGGKIPLVYKDDELQTVYDIRLGGMIPLYNNKVGRVNLLISAAYNLNGAFDESKLPAGLTTSNNPKHASLSFGLNYLFNIVDYFAEPTEATPAIK